MRYRAYIPEYKELLQVSHIDFVNKEFKVLPTGALEGGNCINIKNRMHLLEPSTGLKDDTTLKQEIFKNDIICKCWTSLDFQQICGALYVVKYDVINDGSKFFSGFSLDPVGITESSKDCQSYKDVITCFLKKDYTVINFHPVIHVCGIKHFKLGNIYNMTLR